MSVRPKFSTRPSAAFICERHVVHASSILTRKAVLLLSAIVLGGCGTPAAKDFGGRWKPVNRFQATTTEIPLDRPYTYYASPMDETLRTMLTRWTGDTGMTLLYRLPSDYTLFAPVSGVRTTDIRQAASELSSIYAAQGVSISVEGDKLQVAHSGTLGSRLLPAANVAPASRPSGTTRTSSETTAGGR